MGDLTSDLGANSFLLSINRIRFPEISLAELLSNDAEMSRRRSQAGSPSDEPRIYTSNLSSRIYDLEEIVLSERDFFCTLDPSRLA